MKILLHALSLVVIIVAASFSYMGKGKLEEQQKYRISTIEQNRVVTGKIDDTKAELKDENGKLDVAKTTLAETEQKIGILETEVQDLESQLARAEADKKDRENRIASIQKSLEEVQKLVGDLGFVGELDAATLSESIEQLEKRREALNNKITELETNIEGAEKAIEKNREEIARLSKLKADRDSRILSNSRESVVTAVDAAWGFVVIGAGRNSGFEPRGRLVVKRSGRIVAEVVPSSIEASQTIAEIDFETLAQGAMIQPGDEVIPLKPFTN